MSEFLIVGLCAYLLGSIPFGFLLVKIFRDQDIRDYGSGNIGATNVARSGAKALGALTLLLDTAKGFAAVMLARFVAHHTLESRSALLLAIAAVLALAGHVFPIWLRFRGGKGVATGLGISLALTPWAALAAVGVFLAVFLISRYVSLSSMFAAVALPFLAFFLYRDLDILILGASAVASLVIIVKHHENIHRLLTGTENKFGVKSA